MANGSSNVFAIVATLIAIVAAAFGAFFFFEARYLSRDAFSEAHLTAPHETLVPGGTIVAWHPQASEGVPEGWAICNGENGTPNLVGRFLRGSANPYEHREGGRASYDSDDARTDDCGSNPCKYFVQNPQKARRAEVLPPYYEVVFIIKL